MTTSIEPRRGGHGCVAVLKEMFDRMVVGKRIDLVDNYYAPDFMLYTNGRTQDLTAFRAGHEKVYSTPIAYLVEYDEDAWVETADRAAGRMWITTQRAGESSTRIEVVLIAAFRNRRIVALWELTWPDWTRVSALDSYSKNKE